MSTSFAATEVWAQNVAPGLRIGVVKIAWANVYATSSNTFSAATYGGFDGVYCILPNSRSLPGYVVTTGVSTTTLTPNLYRENTSGVPTIVADGVNVGDNKYCYLTIFGY